MLCAKNTFRYWKVHVSTKISHSSVSQISLVLRELLLRMYGSFPILLVKVSNTVKNDKCINKLDMPGLRSPEMRGGITGS